MRTHGQAAGCACMHACSRALDWVCAWHGQAGMEKTQQLLLLASTARRQPSSPWQSSPPECGVAPARAEVVDDERHGQHAQRPKQHRQQELEALRYKGQYKRSTMQGVGLGVAGRRVPGGEQPPMPRESRRRIVTPCIKGRLGRCCGTVHGESRCKSPSDRMCSSRLWPIMPSGRMCCTLGFCIAAWRQPPAASSRPAPHP